MARFPPLNVIDLMGASHASLRDFRLLRLLHARHRSGDRNPECLDIVQCGLGRHEIVNVHVDGEFSIAAWYILQVASSAAERSQFYNYKPGAMTVIFTGNNMFGASSAFTTINNANDYAPSD
jgi:hypothetical protein